MRNVLYLIVLCIIGTTIGTRLFSETSENDPVSLTSLGLLGVLGIFDGWSLKYRAPLNVERAFVLWGVSNLVMMVSVPLGVLTSYVALSETVEVTQGMGHAYVSLFIVVISFALLSLYAGSQVPAPKHKTP